jgi:hypothetical protein
MTARSLQAASVGLTVAVMDVGDGVTGRGKGVRVTGRVAVRKKGVGLTSFGETEILQAVRVNIRSREVKAKFRMDGSQSKNLVGF